jgi:hypothetical protein
MEISIDGFGKAIAVAINEAIAGERERILNAIKNDAVVQTQIDITVLNYLIEMLEL